MGAGLNLYGQLKLICKFLFMSIKPPVFACKVHMSYRTDVIKKSGKIVTYKDGKKQQTIYEIAKVLFNMDDFSEDKFEKQ